MQTTFRTNGELEGRFEDFHNMCAPPNFPPELIDSVKMAFFAGARSAVIMIKNGKQSELVDEIANYNGQVKKSVLGEKAAQDQAAKS